MKKDLLKIWKKTKAAILPEKEGFSEVKAFAIYRKDFVTFEGEGYFDINDKNEVVFFQTCLFAKVNNLRIRLI